ncbi:hypothetical protein B0J12DRAFT_703915 [Macrophomina phaseolina]|uniref:Uncharacterized protein n=1 Tax=Macrophomina phaseolina TaxID=35725 RepID=A0ABQ8FWW4_9PEZI|nr:hypothetical protein B0J12DRAFT_703915 [Macrophomina phaseolina]
MRRSSKFAISLPGRRARGEGDAHLEHVPTVGCEGLRPSKVERLLGANLPRRRTRSAAYAHASPRNNSAAPSLGTEESHLSISPPGASRDFLGRLKHSPAADDSLLMPPHSRFLQDASCVHSRDRSGSDTCSIRSRPPNARASSTTPTRREDRARAVTGRGYESPYDNAKVNRRRPPPGIQHWFDGLSEEDDDDDSDDEEEDEEEEEKAVTPVRADMKVQESRSLPLQQPSSNYGKRQASAPQHGRKTPKAKVAPTVRTYPPIDRVRQADCAYLTERVDATEGRAAPQTYLYRADHFQAGLESLFSDKPHLRGQPSQAYPTSHETRISSWAETSKMSNRDLNGHSALSISSSDDESDLRSSSSNNLPVIRDSIAMSIDTEDEILVAIAQAIDLKSCRSRTARRVSAASGMAPASGASLRSSTTAAIIDIMLSPTTASRQTNLALPRHSNSRIEQRSQYPRQGLAFLADDQNISRHYAGSFSDERDTSSINSVRIWKSEQGLNKSYKRMSVTKEEETLLRLVRRKGAALAKKSSTDGHQSAAKAKQVRSGIPSSPQN